MEDEQLKNSLNASNYRAQNNQQPPIHQSPILPQYPHSQHHAQQPSQPTVMTQQHVSSHGVGQPPQHRQSSFSPSDLSFLVTGLKDVLKEDLGREIAKIKENLNVWQVQNAIRPQNITPVSMPQTQAVPNLYSYPIQGMAMGHQVIHRPS